MLKQSERVDDLLTHDLRIIQSDEVFSFSMDAVLLARFASVPPRGRVVDLCTGNGVVPLLLTTRTKAGIVGIEIQERVADMASRNVHLNGLGQRITIVHDDLKEAPSRFGHGYFDAVTVNPPYLPVQAGDQNLNPHLAAARHEIFCTLEEVISVCAKLVKTGGKVTMVHRPSRLVDIVSLMRTYKLEPKRLRFVHPRVDSEANMILIEAMKDGKPDIRLLPPLVVYKNETDYCDELMDIYYGQQRSVNSDEGTEEL